MVYSVPPNVKRNIRIIVISSILLGLVLVINAVVSAYLLRENTIKARMHQLGTLTVILSEHTSQTIFSAKTALESIEDVVEISKLKNEEDYKRFAAQKSQFDLLKEKVTANTIIDVATFVGKNGQVLNFSAPFLLPRLIYLIGITSSG